MTNRRTGTPNLLNPLPALGLAFLFLLIGIAPGAKAQPTRDATGFVQSFSDQAVALLADRGLSATDREVAFGRLFTTKFDVALISRFVLGKHWRTATRAQRTEFRRLFEQVIVTSYVRRLEAYAGETLAVGDARRAGNQLVAVSSQILRPKAAPIGVDWRLRRTGEAWQIIDVVVEGVSLALTQRAEFEGLIKQKGGGIEALLETLRSRASRPDILG